MSSLIVLAVVFVVMIGIALSTMRKRHVRREDEDGLMVLEEE